MKFKFFDRALLMLYSLLGIICSLCIGAVAVFMGMGEQQSISALGYHDVALANSSASIAIVGAVALVLLAWSIRMLTLAFLRKPKADKSSVSVQNTEDGSVRISVQAMDMLVKQAIGNTEGVADIKTRIVNHEDSITVRIDMTLQSDVHIPNVTMMMQRSIKNFIEEFSGIAVREVTILVGKIIEVTPRPPLQIKEPDAAPQIIDQPDAIVIQPEAELAESEAEAAVELPVDNSAQADEAVPAQEAPDQIDAAEPNEQGEPESATEADIEAKEDITEKDFW